MSNAGKFLRERVVSVLGFWHVYKHCTFAIWENYAVSFITGLCHELFPSAPFKLKPRHLSSAATVLSYIRLSYPNFRDELMAALRTPDLSPASKIHLINLKALCEFYIPVVHNNHMHMFTLYISTHSYLHMKTQQWIYTTAICTFHAINYSE